MNVGFQLNAQIYNFFHCAYCSPITIPGSIVTLIFQKLVIDVVSAALTCCVPHLFPWSVIQTSDNLHVCMFVYVHAWLIEVGM